MTFELKVMNAQQTGQVFPVNSSDEHKQAESMSIPLVCL